MTFTPPNKMCTDFVCDPVVGGRNAVRQRTWLLWSEPGRRRRLWRGGPTSTAIIMIIILFYNRRRAANRRSALSTLHDVPRAPRRAAAAAAPAAPTASWGFDKYITTHIGHNLHFYLQCVSVCTLFFFPIESKNVTEISMTNTQYILLCLSTFYEYFHTLNRPELLLASFFCVYLSLNIVDIQSNTFLKIKIDKWEKQ